MRTLVYFSLLILLSLATSCLKDPFSESAEDVAERIRADTPTELPPITSEGANTMGAYVEVDTGRVLFVASGVNRSGAVGTESSSCDGMYATLYESESYVFIDATWCSRPEVQDDRVLKFGISIGEDDTIIGAVYKSGRVTKKTNLDRNYSSYEGSMIIDNIIRNPEANQISGGFSGLLIRKEFPYDTVKVKDGRFDVTYGTTP